MQILPKPHCCLPNWLRGDSSLGFGSKNAFFGRQHSQQEIKHMDETRLQDQEQDQNSARSSEIDKKQHGAIIHYPYIKKNVACRASRYRSQD